MTRLHRLGWANLVLSSGQRLFGDTQTSGGDFSRERFLRVGCFVRRMGILVECPGFRSNEAVVFVKICRFAGGLRRCGVHERAILSGPVVVHIKTFAG